MTRDEYFYLEWKFTHFTENAIEVIERKVEKSGYLTFPIYRAKKQASLKKRHGNQVTAIRECTNA